jgi:alpha-N-arabinofuranosidase
MTTDSPKEYHVSLNGDDCNPGTEAEPFKTISAAANVACPGETITVHEGVYREQVDPPRGGLSDDQRITYQAAPGEAVAIKGSEIVKEWTHLDGKVWMVTLDNDYFGAFNPFANVLGGDWFFPQGRTHHTGMVFLNDVALNEAKELDELFDGPRAWFAKSKNLETRIWVNFGEVDPNEALVEITKRQTVFYPSKPEVNYITVRGFTLSQAATPWSPPTTEQIGLIGVNWSKGWVIENNTISHSRCTGLTLGKYFDRDDGRLEYGYNAHYQTVKRVLDRGDWSREKVGGHLIRNNHIFNCGQAGIVGSHGGAFCTITGNVIHDIHVRQLFGGFEQAGIKLHAPVDTTISNNLIYGCNMGVWLDWMTQGTRISGNAMYGNKSWDLFVEISHGPYLVDNNVLMSATSLLDSAQGGAYVHNLFGGNIRYRAEAMRSTQYFKPHSTELVGAAKVLDGDERFYNNILLAAGGLAIYDSHEEEIVMDGNVFVGTASSSRLEDDPLCATEADGSFVIEPQGAGVMLKLKLSADWRQRQCQPVTTERLGKTRVPGQEFDNPDGTPIAIDTDYFGNVRDLNSPFPGPFELLEDSDAIEIWQAKSRVSASGQAADNETDAYETEPR